MIQVIKFLFLLVILLSALLLLGATGRGLSGLYIITFFTLLTVVFGIVYFARIKTEKQEKGCRFLKFNFEVEVFLLVTLALVWISLLDFFSVETFKALQFDFNDNTYWVIMFSGLAPMFFMIIAMSFFIGTYHISHTIRIIVLSSFLLNANINDLFYYKLFSKPFPAEWPWLYQPRFIFGEHITTPEVFIWATITTVMGLIAFSFPYELFVPYQIDYKNKTGGKKRMRTYEMLILVCFFLAGIIYAHYLTDNIYSSIQQQANN